MSAGLVWLALDGVGHPDAAPGGSVWETALPTLRPVIDAGLALDATLGVPGLPQSGTGQSSWLTGQNAARLMNPERGGEHFGPYPGPTLQRLLRAEALPVRVRAAGGQAALLNAYPPAYLAAHAQRPRHGCFPYSFLAAGLPLNPPGLPSVPPTLGLSYAAPWEALSPLSGLVRLGEQLAHAARLCDLLVLDLWFSDTLGHQGRPEVPAGSGLLAAGKRYLQRLDALVEGLLQAGARVVLTSDHGNFENLQLKAHTLSPVPFAGVGVALGRPHDIAEGGATLASWFGLPSASSESTPFGVPW